MCLTHLRYERHLNQGGDVGEVVHHFKGLGMDNDGMYDLAKSAGENIIQDASKRLESYMPQLVDNFVCIKKRNGHIGSSNKRRRTDEENDGGIINPPHLIIFVYT